MAKRFNDELNADIRNTMRNAIQKVRRAEKRGEKGLPTIPMVREFKHMFVTERDAKKELAQYRKLLNNKQALERHRTKEGTISNWEFDYIVNNLKETDRYLNRQINKARERYKDYPDHLYAIRADLSRLMDEKTIINRDLDNLTAKELKTISATIENYKRRNIKISTGRDYFMKNLDSLLTAKGILKSKRERIYKKINNLTNEEFEEFYKRHDVMTDIFLAIPSPTGEGLDNKERQKLAEDALNNDYTSTALDEWVQSLNTNIEDAKEAVDNPHLDDSIGKGKNKITYKEWMELFD